MRLLSASVIFIFMVSCNKSLTPSLGKYQAGNANKPVANPNNIDYSNLYFWAAHPNKKDPADMVPKGIKNETRSEVADVFYIHPTTLTKKEDSAITNADIFNDKLNRFTDYSAILYQASAFNQHAKVYAPRYRQAHILNYFKSRKITQPYFDTAYSDIKKAFEYYLTNNNNGRPIIIASHSQGTEHAGRLLKDFFEGKPLQKQLVAAYIIGMPLPIFYFTKIAPCNTPTQTGCACGWRTFKAPFVPDYIKNEPFASVVINPLTFTNATGYVSRFKNKGSVLKNFNKVVKNVTGAQINGKVLHTPKLHFMGSFLFKSKNYHVGDINLFYINIRENVALRLANFKMP